MTKITREELRRMLAEKVMGYTHRSDYNIEHTSDAEWISSQGYVDSWNPLEEANHRDMMLQAWRDSRTNKKAYAEINIGFKTSCTLSEIGSVAYYIVSYVESANLNHAVCLAVAEAKTGIKYELIEE